MCLLNSVDVRNGISTVTVPIDKRAWARVEKHHTGNALKKEIRVKTILLGHNLLLNPKVKNLEFASPYKYSEISSIKRHNHSLNLSHFINKPIENTLWRFLLRHN